MEVYATGAVASAQRFAYWREAICDVFVHLDADPVGPVHAFDGSIHSGASGTLRVSEVNAGPQHVVRSPRQIAKDSGEWLLVSVQVAGRGRIEQDGRVAALERGDFALYDSARPYVLHFDASFRQHVLQFPRDALRARLHDPERLSATRVRGDGAGAIMTAFVGALLANVDELDATTAHRMGTQGLDLLAAALGAGAGGTVVGPEVHRMERRARAHALIEANLHHPDLTPAAIAAALHLSVRTLHKLFSGDTETVSRLVLRRRLERAAADLADPAQAERTVTDIAFSWGFRDAAHFSRAFKERYGLSPLAHRRTHYPSPPQGG